MLLRRAAARDAATRGAALLDERGACDTGAAARHT